MEERTQEYYMCGGDLHTLPPLWVQCAEAEERAFWQRVGEAQEQAQPEVDVAPFPGFVAYEEAATKYALLQREHFELQETFAHQQCEAEKWRQLYSVSRHQASRALDMLNAAKVQIEVLENKLNGRQ